MSALRRGSTSGGVLRAALAGGPILVVATTLAVLYRQVPMPITIEPQTLVMLPGLLLVSAIFLSPIVGIVSAIGAGVRTVIGDHLALARSRLAWAAVGGAIAATAAQSGALWADAPSFGFALTCAGAGCGGLAKGSRHWTAAGCPD